MISRPNRLTKTTDAQGGMVQFSYDASGNRLTHTDQNNHTTNFGGNRLLLPHLTGPPRAPGEMPTLFAT